MVPFAALPGWTERYQVEERVVRVSPNASLFEAALERTSPVAPLASVLVVGNPDVTTSTRLPALQQAAAEAATVSRLYERADILMGSAATRDAVLRGLPGYDGFHFAGHSVVNSVSPGQSRLVLAGAVDEGITATDISRLNLARLRLVVLASCDSLGGTMTRSEGPMGLARAFLSAGAGTVVASLAPVADRATAALTTLFHREFVNTRDAAAALRLAQLAMLRSSDPELAAPEHWAYFVVVGAS
jgi:CHAT domain-containing protein